MRTAVLFAVLVGAAQGAGFPNVPRTPGELLSGLHAPQQGRTAIICYHNGVLFTVPESASSVILQPWGYFDSWMRTWDISDPTDPQLIEIHGPTQHPIMAHGYYKRGDYLVVGGNWPPENPSSFRDLGPLGMLERTAAPDFEGSFVRGHLFQPWFIGPTYWSYDANNDDAVLSRGNTQFATWDHLGLTGVIGHPFIVGNLLIYASDQTRTGVATYDISDPTNPVLLDVLKHGGAGGYWPELWGGDGKLYVVFPYRTGGNGIRVVDITDPTDLQFVADTPLPGDECMYLQFQDEYGFTGSHKVDMRTFQSVLDLDGANTMETVDHNGDGSFETGIDTSQFALPIGNLLVTGGSGPNQGMAIWAHQSDPDTRGPSVGYHIPRTGQTNYPVGAPITLLIHETIESATLLNGTSFIVRPVGGASIDGLITFAFDDILTFTPDNDLLPDTTYEVVLPAGGIEDVAGNGMEAYSFTFSTGSTVAGNLTPVIDSFTASDYPATPGQNVTFTASVSDPDMESVEIRFDFGDGSPKTAWGAATMTNHSYADPGHYQAKIQTRDPSGVIATGTLTVTVISPPVGPRPTHSSQIVCDEANRRIWTVNPDNDIVTAIDADTLAKLFEVPVGKDPRSLALDASGNIWVACHDDDRIDILSGTTGQTIDRILTGYGSAPFGIAFTPDGSNAFASCHGSGELKRLDAAARSETGSLAVGPTPRAVAVTGDGTRVLVTRYRSPLNHAEVWDVNAATLTLTQTHRIPKFGGDGNRDTTASGKGVANALAAIAISPDGQSAWIASTKVNNERGLVFADDLDQDNTVRNIVSRIDLATNAFAGAFDLDNSDSASAIAFSPLGDRFFVTLQGNNEMIVFDALAIESSADLGAVERRLGSGLAPQGVCADAATGRVFIKDFIARTVSVFEFDTFLQTGGSIPLPSMVSTVASEKLTSNLRLGKEIFYNAGDPRMSAEGYISCATCHNDGGHDGRVWDFTGRGEGFRNTTTLRGKGGLGQGNVHWTANFDEIQDFENDIRNAFGGAGFLSDPDFAATSNPLGAPKAGLSADLDALAAYLTSLGTGSLPRSPHRTSDGAMTADAIAGKAVYDSMNCASCHSPAALQTSTLSDVGTIRTTSGNRIGQALTGLDAPTLQGIWNTAPYFHDGSARTLEDVFTVAGGADIPAESGTPGGGGQVFVNYVDLNNDDTVYGQSYVGLNQGGQTLTLSNFDGGAGGLGALEFRYSTAAPFVGLNININGLDLGNVVTPSTGNIPNWRETYWDRVRVEDVALNSGATNTVVFTTVGSWPGVALDSILVSTADDLAQALPHRQVLALAPTDRDNLLAYLRQLDGGSESATSLLSTFGIWSAAHGLDPNATDDTDTDELEQLAEYGFDLDPHTPDVTGAPTLAFNPDPTIVYRRNRNAPDVLLIVMHSDDLDSWQPVNIIEEVIDTDPDGDNTAELVQVTVNSASSLREFYRIDVQLLD